MADPVPSESGEPNVYEEVWKQLPRRPIEVTHPVIKGRWKKYVEYKVRSPGMYDIQDSTNGAGDGRIEVHRRFRHFVWLYETLCALVPGVFIPPLPEKRVLGNMDNAFVTKRQRALERFLNRLYEKPVIRDHPAFHAFLEHQHEAQFAQVQAKISEQVAKCNSEQLFVSIAKMSDCQEEVTDLEAPLFVNALKSYFARLLDSLEAVLKNEQRHVLKVQEVSPVLHDLGESLFMVQNAHEECPILSSSTTKALDMMWNEVFKVARVTRRYPTMVAERVEDDLVDFVYCVRSFLAYVQLFEKDYVKPWEKFNADYKVEKGRTLTCALNAEKGKAPLSSSEFAVQVKLMLERDDLYQEHLSRYRTRLILFLSEIEQFLSMRCIELQIIFGSFCAFWRNFATFMMNSYRDALDMISVMKDDFEYKTRFTTPSLTSVAMYPRHDVPSQPPSIDMSPSVRSMSLNSASGIPPVNFNTAQASYLGRGSTSAGVDTAACQTTTTTTTRRASGPPPPLPPRPGSILHISTGNLPPTPDNSSMYDTQVTPSGLDPAVPNVGIVRPSPQQAPPPPPPPPPAPIPSHSARPASREIPIMNHPPGRDPRTDHASVAPSNRTRTPSPSFSDSGQLLQDIQKTRRSLRRSVSSGPAVSERSDSRTDLMADMRHPSNRNRLMRISSMGSDHSLGRRTPTTPDVQDHEILAQLSGHVSRIRSDVGYDSDNSKEGYGDPSDDGGFQSD